MMLNIVHLTSTADATTAPVTNRLANASGSITFQPQDINWSKRGRGSDARSRMKKQMKKNS